LAILITQRNRLAIALLICLKGLSESLSINRFIEGSASGE
jgi:hypothetical protein